MIALMALDISWRSGYSHSLTAVHSNLKGPWQLCSMHEMESALALWLCIVAIAFSPP